MLKSKLKNSDGTTVYGLQTGFSFPDFIYRSPSYTEALRYAAFPEKITLIHFFFTFVKIQENFK